MYKNQLQELAQRSCFNLPSYSCIREGPDHAPRFKAAVNFNGETFESPQYCSTLRQAEHSAAEVALNALAGRGPSNSLAARVLSFFPSSKDMYRNILQTFTQRSCFNLPSYTCIREVPDCPSCFNALISFNGETFICPNFCWTLRHAEHCAAEVALENIAASGPPNSLASKMLDETGVYKNLLQEVSQRVGASLPAYSTFRSGLGHLPVFTCTVELAGIIFTGEPAKNKKQAEKNAAMAAWTSLKILVQQFETSAPEKVKSDEQEHVTVARALQKYLVQARMAKVAFPIKFQTQKPRPLSTQQAQATSSKILPFICPRPNRSRPFTVTTPNSSSLSSKIGPQSRPHMAAGNDTITKTLQGQQSTTALDDSRLPPNDNTRDRPLKFPAAGAAPYIPIRHFTPRHRFAPPVTIRNAIPVFSSPPRPAASLSPRMTRPPSSVVAPPVLIRPPTPVLPPPVCLERLSLLDSTFQAEEAPCSKAPSVKSDEELVSKAADAPSENQPSALTFSGKVDGPSVAKAPTILPEESLSNSPTSESLANCIEGC